VSSAQDAPPAVAPGALPAPSWLSAQRARLAAAYRNGRLPQALLIHEAPGAGGEWLARWLAQLVLCQHRERAPCGSCQSCQRAAALQHPDFSWLGLLEESRQIRIEQVRELVADLALTSHAGGYKVGVIAPADALNHYAANALLKTLEEPSPRTLLVLVVTQPSRLPATILSRCQRVRLPAPNRTEAIAWLTAAYGAADWGAALEVVGDAPLLAGGAQAAQLAEAGAEARGTLEELATGGADPVAAAERWARSETALRLRCFENWLTERIRRAESDGTFFAELRPEPYLSGGQAFLNIRELFGMLEEVRDLRASLDVPLNRGLALEALFRRLTPTRGGEVRAHG
jgi:DNA polymerase-3 subunit delta'